MEEIGIVFIGVVLLFLFCWAEKYYFRTRLFAHVSWCTAGDSKHLLKYMCFSPAICGQVEKKFLLYYDSEQEKQAALDILDAYRAHLSEMYFQKLLTMNWHISKMSNEDYFMFTLRSFLLKKECCTTLNGNVMYKELSRTEYGYWGSQLYSAKYELTDFGAVFNKLLYAVQIYCENSKVINKKHEIIQSSTQIQERLTSNLIEISVI